MHGGAPTFPVAHAASDSGVYPIALLVEELKSEDSEVRINAMRKLHFIAKALGPDRSRAELLPFLSGKCCCAVAALCTNPAVAGATHTAVTYLLRCPCFLHLSGEWDWHRALPAGGDCFFFSLVGADFFPPDPLPIVEARWVAPLHASCRLPCHA